jgi:signal recognition particle subunit SRP54
MFETLTTRLSAVLDSIRGQGRLTEDQVAAAARELRMALLEADVALPVVREFTERIKVRALGSEIGQSLTPVQQFLRIVQQELTATLGGTAEPINLRSQPPAIILMAGLQGAGKTTTVGKLARYLNEQLGKRVTVVSADVYRPAAIEQLRLVAAQVGADWFPSTAGQAPAAIVREALAHAKKEFADVLIVDMMREIAELHAALNPVETLFVVDSMTGQDAARTAKAFADAVPLTGVVLTKIDGDARGGAALSVRQVTGKPIKFLGVGEKSDKLEVFHPERIASRILGQGDMLGLIEETARKVDAGKAAKFAQKLKKTKTFDLADFREQMQQMQDMGSLDALLDKLPGGAQLQSRLKNVDAGRQIRRSVAIINSMTPQERRFPELLKASRKRRIAAGAGLQVQEINQLLRQFETTRDMMKKVAGGGMAKMMRSLAGRLPPGMLPKG